MTDLIRRAVELADGWDIDVDHDDVLIDHASTWQVCTIDDVPQTILDAIAAQLVRQIESIGDYRLVISIEMTSVYIGNQLQGRYRHRGRTMNTTQACVEFLEERKT